MNELAPPPGPHVSTTRAITEQVLELLSVRSCRCPCVLQEDRVHFQAVLSCFYFALMLVCSPECIFLDIRCELPLDNNLLVENRRHESVVLLRLPRVFLAIPGGRFSGRR